MANDSSATKISELDNTYPDGSVDTMDNVDNQLRMLKSVLDFHFSALGDTALTATAEELNQLAGITLASSNAIIDNFEGDSDPGANPTRIVFQQENAPTGWTKSSDYNDRAMRVVTGTVGDGGTVGFNTLFARTATDSHTLTTGEIPAHSHVINNGFLGQNHGSLQANTSAGSTFTNILPWTGTNSTNPNTGGDGGHTHNIDMRIKYCDVIIGVKD